MLLETQLISQKFDHTFLSIIASTAICAYNTCIAAIAFRKSWAKVIKQLADYLAIYVIAANITLFSCPCLLRSERVEPNHQFSNGLPTAS